MANGSVGGIAGEFFFGHIDKDHVGVALLGFQYRSRKVELLRFGRNIHHDLGAGAIGQFDYGVAAAFAKVIVLVNHRQAIKYFHKLRHLAQRDVLDQMEFAPWVAAEEDNRGKPLRAHWRARHSYFLLLER